MEPMEPTDDELLKLGSGGDNAAIALLIRRYAGFVNGIALRQTGDSALSEDISQAVFIVFLHRMKTIRSGRSIPSWLFKATRMTVWEARRASGRRVRRELAAAKPEAIVPNENSEQQEQLSLVDEAIARLGRTDRNIILMRYFQSLEVDAIAERLAIDPRAARQRLTRAIQRLRKFVGVGGDGAAAGAVESVLVVAGGHQATLRVLEVSSNVVSGHLVSRGAVSLSKGVLKMMFIQKCVAVALMAAVFVLMAGGGLAILHSSLRADESHSTARARPAASQPVPPVKIETLAQATTALKKEYALKDGEVLRMISPPFSDARNVYADMSFPEAAGPGQRARDNIRSLGFRWKTGTGGEEFSWGYMSYIDETLGYVVDDTLGIDWEHVEGLGKIHWKKAHADFVVRSDATDQQKLDALAALIRGRSGQAFKFVPSKVTVSAFMLYGDTTSGGAAATGGMHAVLLSQEMPTPEIVHAITNGDRRGMPDAFNLEQAGKYLCAPFRMDNSSHSVFSRGGTVYYIAKNAQLSRSDPQYQQKLRKILDNLQAQIGGDFQIVPLEIEVFTAVPAN